MNLTEFSCEVHQNAVEHGWWDEKHTFGEVIALCHSELSEALEEYRAGRPMEYLEPVVAYQNHLEFFNKPGGIAVEMADCIIRILDWCGKEGVDIQQEYEKMPIMAWISSLKFGDIVSECHCCLSAAYEKEQWPKTSAAGHMARCIKIITEWAKHNSVDIYRIMQEKHAYNKTRPYRHGGKVL